MDWRENGICVISLAMYVFVSHKRWLSIYTLMHMNKFLHMPAAHLYNTQNAILTHVQQCHRSQ
jgi:hypothetical protein